jgi:hypothetical protein
LIDMKKQRVLGDAVAYVLLTLLVIYSIFPFVWMALSAFGWRCPH